jgi:hypothetical protein
MKRIYVLAILIIVCVAPLLSAEEEEVDVLFDITKEVDTTYGSPVAQGDMLLGILDEAGISHAFTAEGEMLEEIDLSQYKVLVLWDPDGSYTEDEMEVIWAFVEGGGALVFAGTSFYNTPDNIYANFNELLSPFGIKMIREQVLDKTNYVGCHCGTTPIITMYATGYYFYDVEQIAFSHTSRIEISGDATVIAFGDNDAFVDVNGNEMHDPDELEGAIPVMAQSSYGDGVVVVFGTEKIFERNYISRLDNGVFAENLFSDLIYSYSVRNESSSDSMVLYAAVGAIAILAGICIAVVIKRRK